MQELTSTPGKARKVLEYVLATNYVNTDNVGLGVYGGVAVISRELDNDLWFIDITQEVKTQPDTIIPVTSPKGIFVTDDGFLYLLEGSELVKYDVDWNNHTISNRQVIVSALEDPQHVRVYNNEIYISDWGLSHRIKVYDMNGVFKRFIGPVGKQQFGFFNKSIMYKPSGFDFVGDEVWVGMQDSYPKRIGIYDALSGDVIRVIYGGPKYGGQGKLDSNNKSRLFYLHSNRGDKAGIEFSLDWNTGTYEVVSI